MEDFYAFREYLERVVRLNCGIELDERAAGLFERFARLLVTENEKYNLTAITRPDEIALLHFCDSLTISRYIPEGASVCDVGAGAGFPSLPLAIVRSDLRITAVDATAKKTVFLQKAAEELSLRNLTALTGRAEELFSSAARKNLRARFDAVTARAVARAGVLCELGAAGLREHGKLILMKGERAEEELAGSEAALRELGLRFVSVEKMRLEDGEREYSRNVIIFERLSKTSDKYPRRFAKIKSEPLF